MGTNLLDRPWMHPLEIACIEKYLNKNTTMLEWGSGGSTCYFPKLVKKYYSIEHQEEWFSKVKDQVPGNVKYCFVPANNTDVSIKVSAYKDYVDYIEKAALFNQVFDVVLIDGRARFECARFILDHIHSGSIVIIHDFYKKNRGRYRQVFKYYDEIESVKITTQTVVILKPKNHYKRPWPELFQRIRRHLQYKIPLSVVRLGDGEYYAANSVNKKKDTFNVPFKKHLGHIPNNYQKKAISKSIVESCRQADVIALNKYQSAKWSVARRYFLKISKHLYYYSADFHTEFMQRGLFEKLIKETDKLLFISGHDLSGQFKSKYPHLKTIKKIIIPKQPRYFKTKGNHHPDHYNKTIAKIEKMNLDGYLCLVGAGFIGKKYIIKCKESGGVAIDIGSVFDRWAGYITRGRYKGFEKKDTTYEL